MTRHADLQSIHAALCSIAQRRAALDAEEARWLHAAESAQLWRAHGMVSLLDYLERVLGYTPRMAAERLRVARALADLPHLTDALATNAIAYSGIRELTRVATPETEAAWCDAFRGKTAHEIEQAVTARRPGDLPGAPPHPDLQPQVLRFDVLPETHAQLRAARAALDAEHGQRLTDDEFLAALAARALSGAAALRRPQPVTTIVCERCAQGWQTAAGATVPATPATTARAQCDAQRIDGPRATQDIPAATRRAVFLRDRGTCTVPGCRSTRHLEVHHIVRRADGGTHALDNLHLLCAAHHQAHHAEAPPTRLAAAALRLEAKAALVTMGWKPAIAIAAVDQAITQLGSPAVPIAELLRAALRCCPTRAATAVLPTRASTSPLPQPTNINYLVARPRG